MEKLSRKTKFQNIILGPRYLKMKVPKEWMARSLEKIVTKPVSYGVLVPDSDPNGVPMIRSSKIESHEEIEKNLQLISKTLEEKFKKTRLVGGEILFSVVGTPGQLTIAPKRFSGWNVSRAVAVIKIKSDLETRFVSIFLKSDIVQKKIKIETIGSAQPVINLGALKKISIPFPQIKEQKKIIEILSTVDEAIENSDAIIKETQQLKKGLMQKLFLRKAFTLMKLAKLERTNLEPIYLKDFGKIITGTTPSTKVKKYYTPSTHMFIGPADLGKRKVIINAEKHISEDGFSVSRRLPQNAVMVVCIGASIGKVGITSEPCATNQQVNSIIPKNEFPANYVYYVLSGIKKYLFAFSGDTATPILNKGEFGRVVTFVHKQYDERVKITSILSEFDAKIENEQNTKAELEQVKKGLMQILLTGKIRVKV